MSKRALTRRQAIVTSTGAALGAALFAPGQAVANTVPFDDAWEHLTFRSLSPNRFERRPSQLSVVSDGSSSILYRILPRGHACCLARFLVVACRKLGAAL